MFTVRENNLEISNCDYKALFLSDGDTNNVSYPVPTKEFALNMALVNR